MDEEKAGFVFYMPLVEEQSPDQFTTQSQSSLKAIPLSLANIHKLAAELEDYRLDTIELHVTGVVKSGPLTQLFIGAEGEAGMKLILNKKHI